MYTYKHFLGYGVIVPTVMLKKSPYSVDKIEHDFRENVIQLDYNHSPAGDMFVGYLLDTKDEDFLEKMKCAEKDINSLFYEIFKIDIPAQYKPKMHAKHGDIWED